jgi:uncharacterized BrkB/YihY/UPF0761 family membrane protein
MYDGAALVMAFIPFLFLLILSVFLAIGVYFLAKKMGKNAVLWAILTIIPIVNYVFLFYVAFQFAYYILDSLNAIRARA